MRRYHIRNNTHMIEFPFSAEGLKQAQQFRRDNPEFKRRHIRDVLQLLPSEVPLGEKVWLK